MKKLSYKLRYFLTLAAFFIIATLLLVRFTDKLQLHLFLNGQNNAFADFFFKYYTHVGDGAFALVLLPFLLFFSKMKHLLLAIFSCFFGGMFAQFCKRVFFYGALRPKGFFQEGVLHIVDGVSPHHINTFPSGHTASGFAFFIFLAFLGKKSPLWQSLCAVLAILVAYSRVYLSHHFLIDVVAGALVGMAGFFCAYATHKKLKSYHWERRTIDWLRFTWAKRAQVLSFSK